MPNVVTFLYAERHTTSQVATHPAADYTRAPLTASALKPSLRHDFLCTVWALHFHRIALTKHTRCSFVFLQFLVAQELSVLRLSVTLFIVWHRIRQRTAFSRHDRIRIQRLCLCFNKHAVFNLIGCNRLLDFLLLHFSWLLLHESRRLDLIKFLFLLLSAASLFVHFKL